MKHDLHWTVPEGFEPHLTYPDGVVGVPVVGLADLPGSFAGSVRTLVFDIAEDRSEAPALPLAHQGELWHSGWDIPTRWAIDAKGLCYMDNAHGHPLGRVDSGSLLRECEVDENRRDMQGRLGLPVDPPAWQLAAKANGWLSAEQTKALQDELYSAQTCLPTQKDFDEFLHHLDTFASDTLVPEALKIQDALSAVRAGVEAALRIVPLSESQKQSKVIMPEVKKPQDTTIVVHLLRAGSAVCQFSTKVPAEWPANHKWASSTAELKSLKPPSTPCGECVRVGQRETSRPR